MTPNYIKVATDAHDKEGFWYMATPYSNYPHGREAAFQEACRAAAVLVLKGVKVFCPIAHTHPIAETGIVTDTHETWMRQDMPLLAAAAGVVVVRMEGWKESRGVKAEVDYALKHGKPVMFMDWEVHNDVKS